MTDQTKIGTVALMMAHVANENCSGDPREPFVALMTAAAVSGHIINRTPEEMHKALDQIMGLAQALMLHATETKQ